MEVTRVLICVALSLVLLADVAYFSPIPNHNEQKELLTLVRHINHEVTQHSRRERRHLRTQQIAMMEFCLRHRQQCRRELQALRDNENEVTVVVVEK